MMHKRNALLRPILRMAAVLGMGWTLAGGAAAQPVITLEGEADGAKYETDRQVRLSLLSWSGEEAGQAVVEAFRDYQERGDADAFADFLEEQQTLGYLFTEAATGYTVKYAWQEDTADGKRMMFMVIPALKTRNPMLWREANGNPEPFSLLELHWQDERATVKTSEKANIAVDENGGYLELEDFGFGERFATMEDSTPYYARQAS